MREKSPVIFGKDLCLGMTGFDRALKPGVAGRACWGARKSPWQKFNWRRATAPARGLGAVTFLDPVPSGFDRALTL